MVNNRCWLLGSIRICGEVALIDEYRAYTSHSHGTDRERICTRTLDAFLRIGFTQTHQSHARAISLLRMRTRFNDQLCQCHRVRPDGNSPRVNISRRILSIPSVCRRHVVFDCRVYTTRHAFAVCSNAECTNKAFNRCRCHPHIDFMLCVLVRYTIVMTIDLDMVIDVDARFLPFCNYKRVLGQWLQGGLVETDKPAHARARKFLKRCVVDELRLNGNRFVKSSQRKECSIPQRCQYAILGDLNCFLHL